VPRHPKAKGQAKVHKVMSEYKEGKLRSSSGQKVTNRKQAVAIAMSEAGLSNKRRKSGGMRRGGPDRAGATRYRS